jgi:hypothetical protein
MFEADEAAAQEPRAQARIDTLESAVERLFTELGLSR